jgi:hypothetical protein
MKFKIKILIIPDGNSSLEESEIIQPVKKLFTPDLTAMPNFWECVPNLEDIDFVCQSNDNSSQIKNNSEKVEKDKDKNKDKINLDYIRLMSLLELSNDNTFVIYVRSTTVSLVPSNNILKLIYDLCDCYINSSDKEKFDLIYLAKWADRCDQYTIIGTAFDNNTNIVETVRPHGLQSVLFSPAGASKIKAALCEPISYPMSLALTQMIANNNLYALTTSPSIMNYNIFEATKNNDYMKTYECVEPPNDCGKPMSQGSNLSLFIFIIILIIVIIIFYFLIVMLNRVPSSVQSVEYYPPQRMIIGEGTK